ncbi:MAG: HAMP domain-containing protein [Ignavibacteriales bacterium]|nr:HAMP domain-containing protein [Ignavibacteriales bacterium]
MVESSPGRRTIHVEEKSHNGTGERWYVGYAPISVDRNPSIGGVWVELSGSRQTLLRGEASEILMNYSREKFETHYRTLILSEYFKGKLITTTNERIPLGRPLPIALQNITNRSNGTWMNDIIDSKSYETLFLPEQSNSSDDGWIALSMEELDLRWHLYSFLRYILFYLILVGVMIAAILMVRWHRGENLTISFRSKLMLAFIIMSLIPIIIVAYYNRQYVMEQAGESSIRRLSDQTSVFVSELEHHYEIDVPAALAQLTDERCAEIANDLNADFNVYYGSSLQASSKSEMFTAELLDPSISAEAYMNIVLQRKSFFTETQTIGTLPYVVGYRPLIAQNGSIFGVVSVPTLYRQTEIDEELTRRNVFLYGAYAIALALSLGVGTILANQISSPIRRLKQATQQIAAGRMDVDLASDRSDEIGELEDAFKQMTKDLQQTQAQMVKAQRELAWKEMAKQVAHEIKNPLTPIKLSVQHLRQAYHDRAKNFDSLLQQVSETILAQIDALSRIASEFSHFARLPERFLVEANVNDVLLEAKNLFQQHAQVQFVEKYANLQPLVIVDRDELRRAFINVIRNAIQAMEERGTITLQTLIDEDAVQIVVLDTGPGIPEEMQEHLFEPNFSTKTDGMGLGLAIVKKIITDLGGTITIEAGERGGTLVRMHLPIAKGSKTLTQPGTVNNA